MTTRILTIVLLARAAVGMGAASGAQTSTACDPFDLNRTESRFVRLRELRRADPGAVYDPALALLQPDDILGAESIYGAPGGCTLGLMLAHDGALLTMTFELGHDVPSKFNTWIVYGNGNLVRLWSVDIPPVVPTTSGSTRVAIPPVGRLGILSTLTTVDGIACAAFEAFDTSP